MTTSTKTIAKMTSCQSSAFIEMIRIFSCTIELDAIFARGCGANVRLWTIVCNFINRTAHCAGRA